MNHVFQPKVCISCPKKLYVQIINYVGAASWSNFFVWSHCIEIKKRINKYVEVNYKFEGIKMSDLYFIQIIICIHNVSKTQYK